MKRFTKRTQTILLILLIIAIGFVIYHRFIEKRNENIVEKKAEQFVPQPQPIIIEKREESSPIHRDPREVNSIDRFWNPLRFPYRSDYFYDQNWYPSNNLPFQVMSGGRRMAPTLGGTEIPIPNPMMPLDISEAPIAPVHITTRGPRGMPQQLGVIYKVQSDHNTYLPLFGMKEYPNSDSYKYYTAVGQNSQIKVPLMTKYKNQPLGDGDEVIIKGQSEKYRVSLYESDFPKYIGYI